MIKRVPDHNGPAITVTDVTKEYGNLTALDGVDVRIAPGSIVGILGPNGAGKTTLIKSILGTVLPDSGRVELFGNPTETLGRRRYEYVSAMLEGARNIYWRMSLRENVRYFTGLQGIDPNAVRAENEELVARLGMSEKLDDPVRELSRGQKQRASLACVLAQQTPIVFLDEPTLGLDVQASRTLRSELSALSDDERTVVLSSHNMDVIQQLCDRVIVLQNGSVIADDAVEGLVGAFQTQRHVLRLSDEPSGETRSRIERTVRSVSWDDSRRLRVTLSSGEQLYSLMDVLREGDVIVESIRSDEPDLEEAFLRVTGDDAKQHPNERPQRHP